MRPDIKKSLDLYASRGLYPGHFLTAVLENDLSEAIGRADNENQRDIAEIVKYIYNHLPSACWGSRERVREWVAERMVAPSPE